MKKIIYGNRLICELACLYTRLKNRKYKAIIEKRSHYSLFEYKGFERPLGRYFTESFSDNNNFGLGLILRNYSRSCTKKVNGWIEHGYFYDDFILPQSVASYARTILTFSNIRAHLIKAKTGKNAIAIGPYIHYADDYIDEKEFSQLKSKMGKILLVFLAHSASGEQVLFDNIELFDKVDSIKANYNTVIVSVFAGDLGNMFLLNEIKNRGYIIFSAGDRFDPLFLSRLKSVIKLADGTMSNAMGTHVVYCTYYNKPHWIIPQQLKHIAINSTGKKNIAISNNYKIGAEISKWKSLFSVYKENITDEQLEQCNLYFGFDCVKTKNEMYEILSSLN